jgi:hypothetical protein
MIAPEILKKHNLKAVPFSCIGEGETFYDTDTIPNWPDDFVEYKRRLKDGDIEYADGVSSLMDVEDYIGETVYVPVWRPCRKPHLMEAWGYKPITL